MSWPSLFDIVHRISDREQPDRRRFRRLGVQGPCAQSEAGFDFPGGLRQRSYSFILCQVG